MSLCELCNREEGHIYYGNVLICFKCLKQIQKEQKKAPLITQWILLSAKKRIYEMGNSFFGILLNIKNKKFKFKKVD